MKTPKLFAIAIAGALLGAGVAFVVPTKAATCFFVGPTSAAIVTIDELPR